MDNAYINVGVRDLQFSLPPGEEDHVHKEHHHEQQLDHQHQHQHELPVAATKNTLQTRSTSDLLSAVEPRLCAHHAEKRAAAAAPAHYVRWLSMGPSKAQLKEVIISPPPLPAAPLLSLPQPQVQTGSGSGLRLPLSLSATTPASFGASSASVSVTVATSGKQRDEGRKGEAEVEAAEDPLEHSFRSGCTVGTLLLQPAHERSPGKYPYAHSQRGLKSPLLPPPVGPSLTRATLPQEVCRVALLLTCHTAHM